MSKVRRIYSRNKTYKEDTKAPLELARAIVHIGLFSRVAKALGVTTSHVTQVAKGTRTSPRVVAAIVDEVRRIDASAQQGNGRAA